MEKTFIHSAVIATLLEITYDVAAIRLEDDLRSDLALDSLDAVDLANQLEEALDPELGLDLSTKIVEWIGANKQATVEQLINFLDDTLAASGIRK